MGYLNYVLTVRKQFGVKLYFAKEALLKVVNCALRGIHLASMLVCVYGMTDHDVAGTCALASQQSIAESTPPEVYIYCSKISSVHNGRWTAVFNSI